MSLAFVVLGDDGPNQFLRGEALLIGMVTCAWGRRPHDLPPNLAPGSPKPLGLLFVSTAALVCLEMHFGGFTLEFPLPSHVCTLVRPNRLLAPGNLLCFRQLRCNHSQPVPSCMAPER